MRRHGIFFSNLELSLDYKKKIMPKRVVLCLKVSLLAGLIFALSMPLKAQSERSLARKFVKSIRESHRTILIHEPAYIYKYNRKLENSKKYARLNKEQMDSISWVKSDFIKNIHDSLFMHYFSEGYVSELKKFGLLPFIGKMPTPTQPDYYSDIVQTELEERYYPHRDTAYVDEKPYAVEKKLNALDVSFWFKVYAAGTKNVKNKEVVFAENLLTDDIVSHFVMSENGTLVYFYKLDKLTLSKIYKYASGLGKDYADFTFDKILNDYLESVLPASKLKGKYWHYDPQYKKLYIGDYYRFIPVNH